MNPPSSPQKGSETGLEKRRGLSHPFFFLFRVSALFWFRSIQDIELMPLDWMGVEGRKRAKHAHPLPPFQRQDGTIFGKVVDAPLFCTGKKGKGSLQQFSSLLWKKKKKKKYTCHD